MSLQSEAANLGITQTHGLKSVVIECAFDADDSEYGQEVAHLEQRRDCPGRIPGESPVNQLFARWWAVDLIGKDPCVRLDQ